LESYKTKMEEYKDETVSLKRQMQEMWVPSGGLLDFKKIYSVSTISIIREKGRSNHIPARGRVCSIVKITVGTWGGGERTLARPQSASRSDTLIDWLLQNEHTGCGTRAGGEDELKYIRR
jgi:hypothetical protein